MRALVIGGTGPTGPFIVNGLLARGYKVAILHRGNHELDEIPPEVEHIHVDPHFSEALEEGLKGREFDLCIATYGRLRLVAEAMVGRTKRFISVGGPGYGGIFRPQSKFPTGELIPVEEASQFIQSADDNKFGYQMKLTEDRVFELHSEATHLRYPYTYGPHQISPHEWLIVRRLRDERRYILAIDGGQTHHPRGYSENVAHAVLLAVDNPTVAAGKIYNCGDERQLTLAQVVEVIADEMKADVGIVGVPSGVGRLARTMMLGDTLQSIVPDLYAIKSDLGYKDVVDPVEGLRRTVRWLLENQPEPGGRVEKILNDPFDYEAEDKFVEEYSRALESLSAYSWDDKPSIHPYAHPKKLGEKDRYGR
ncbi:hypothetical protein GCM10011614_33910 [Novosphingobium colocasiae]|uniref:Epimerase n=1 Tax=Novosphingobium colocasiae TaxID=1256513 RepID=A0A918PMP5_9SPHN|nr:hypothetical protein GCM10011614_33910 [Novosphingobium colocasiae]